MKVPLRTCALMILVATRLAGACLNSAAAQDVAVEEPAPTAAPTVQLAQPPARVQGPLQEIPETTVVGQAGGGGTQGNALPGNTIVETPTRTDTQLGEIGSSVSVVTSEQIAQRQITTVIDALRSLPGVEIVQGGGPGREASVFIRGANSEQTKVLLDGIWLNDPSSPGRGFDFSSLSVDNIDRIEVIRGPQSSLYGSDAIGGVVNIITRRGSGKRQTRVGVMGGSLETQRQWGNITGGGKLFNYSLGGSYFGTQNISSADSRLPGNSMPNPFSLGTLSTRMGFTPTENLEIDFILRYTHSNVKFDNGNVNNLGGAFQDDPNAKTYSNQVYTRSQLRYTALDGFWVQTLSFNTTNIQRFTSNPTDPLNPADSLFETDLGQTQFVNWQNNFRLHKTNTLTIGLFSQQENGSSVYNGTFSDGGTPPMPLPYSGNDPRATLTDRAVYAQDQIKLFNRWFTTIGGRSDDFSQAGIANTYRLTSLFRFPITNTAIRGSLGTGFKAPTVYQLFDAVAGNTTLHPEQSKGWDYGIDQPFFNSKFVLSGTYFRNDFTNLIQFAPDPSSAFGGSYFNVGHAQTEGAEVAGVVNINTSTYMTLNYTRLNAVDLDTGQPLARRPHDQIGMTFNRKLLDNRLNLNVNGSYVGNRHDTDFTAFTPAPVTLRHYWLLNVAATYNLRKNWQVFGRIDNLLDQHYQEIFGYGSVPLTFYAGTNMNW